MILIDSTLKEIWPSKEYNLACPKLEDDIKIVKVKSEIDISQQPNVKSSPKWAPVIVKFTPSQVHF